MTKLIQKHSKITNMSGVRTLFAAITFVTFTALTAMAQNEGSISGSVTDSFGAVVPGAEITLVGLYKNSEITIGQTTSNSGGKYAFVNLALGTYEARVKADWIYRVFRKRIELTSSQPNRSAIVISFEPCLGDNSDEKVSPITGEDKAEIMRRMFDLLFESRTSTPKIILLPKNIDLDWFSADQKSRITIMTRAAIQDLTERDGSEDYYSLTPLKQHGGCVEASWTNNLTVKGQAEEANMAGGGAIYEFRKIAGKWVGHMLSRWIS